MACAFTCMPPLTVALPASWRGRRCLIDRNRNASHWTIVIGRSASTQVSIGPSGPFQTNRYRYAQRLVAKSTLNVSYCFDTTPMAFNPP
jgi:hypothetical protein